MKKFRILCFGDSNTYGQDDAHGRWPSDVRWTRRLHAILGPQFYVIEEGLSGRAVDLGQDEEQRCNGRLWLRPCLESHNPVDVVVVMLGTNDLRPSFRRGPEQIAARLGNLIDDVYNYGKSSSGSAPQALLLSPAPINAKARRFATPFTDIENEQAAKRSERLAGRLQQTARKHGCEFLDVGSVGCVGDDGIHLNQQSHEALAVALAKIIARMKASPRQPRFY